jgi:plastocyanin
MSDLNFSKFNSKSNTSNTFVDSKTKDKIKMSKEHLASRALKTRGALSSRIHDINQPINNVQNIIIPPNVLANNVHFDQQKLNIHIGDVVTWINHDTIDHNIQVFHIMSKTARSALVVSKDLTPFYSLIFQSFQPGEYIFQCSSHNFMKELYLLIRKIFYCF